MDEWEKLVAKNWTKSNNAEQIKNVDKGKKMKKKSKQKCHKNSGVQRHLHQ